MVSHAIAMTLAALSAAAPSPDLESRLEEIARRAGGSVGIAVTHVESGQAVLVNGKKKLPLFSAFKLPLAVVVLQEVEAGRLRLDQIVHVTPADSAPSWKGTRRWDKPVDVTIRELLRVSIALSDNTSSDKLMKLVGGPEVVTERLRALGLTDIEIQAYVRELSPEGRHPNVATAADLAALLAGIQQGRVLKPAQQAVLLEIMAAAETGLRRIRGKLPPGVAAGDKTGTGATATNDIGLVTLPDGSHLSIAVLLTGSPLPLPRQEDVIADLARAAYDSYVPASR